jgi:hypothetical protein
VKEIQSNMRVYIQGTSATPTHLVKAMCKWAKEANLVNIETVHLHLEGVTQFGTRVPIRVGTRVRISVFTVYGHMHACIHRCICVTEDAAAEAEFEKHFRPNCLFIGENMRVAVNEVSSVD